MRKELSQFFRTRQHWDIFVQFYDDKMLFFTKEEQIVYAFLFYFGVITK